MPQFNFAYFLPQLAWLGFIFAVLYFVVVRATLPKLGKVMQDREDRVIGDIGAAETAKGEADAVTQAYLAELGSARDAARETLAGARAEAQRGLEARLAAADGDIGARLSDAQRALETARDAAVAEVEAIAADAAAAIVERFTGARPAAADAAKAAKAALAG